jgi:predicted nucleic acid-binding protein
MLVLDASVPVKWFVPEEGSDQAAVLLNGAKKLFAPSLIRVEVAAALTRKVRIGEVPASIIRPHCAAWPRMLDERIIELSPDEQDYPKAFELAFELKHPFQDCLYLSLALRLDAPLVTADRRFYETASPTYRNVRPLVPETAKKKRS